MLRREEITHDDVAKYYDEQTILYNLNSNDSFHYGFWDETTQTNQQAQENSNRFIAEKIAITEKDIVLDAGCGIGGPAIFMAENYRAKVIGITISGIQLAMAEDRAKNSLYPDLLQFYKRDYTDTAFENGYFTKIYAIESVCHAKHKVDFMKEAFRILCPGGKLIVLDAFLVKKELAEKERKDLEICLKGWYLPSLEHVDDFRADLETTGFHNIECLDMTTRVAKSIRGVYRHGVLGFPITWALSRLGWIPQNVHNSIKTTISSRKLIKKKVGIYGVFYAEKPLN